MEVDPARPDRATLLIWLKFGASAWNHWRREHPEVAIVLDGVNFDGMILTGIDFSAASLRGASMHATNLMNADLRRADLSGANLRERSGANLIVLRATFYVRRMRTTNEARRST